MQPGLFTHRIVSSRWIPCVDALPESSPNFSGKRLFQPIVRHAFIVSWLEPIREFNALHKDEKELLQAYADGANSGLRQLKAKPFEYYLLGVEPRRWTPQDCILVIYAMALDLQDRPGHVELALDALKRALPQKAFEFFAPRISSWDTPLDGSECSSQPPVPNENDFDLRTAKNQLPEGAQQDLGSQAGFIGTRSFRTRDPRSGVTAGL